MTTVDPKLADYATTDAQKRALDAVNRTGSYRAAARELGMKSEDSVRLTIKRLTASAADRGYSPEHSMIRTVPDSYKIKRRSQNFRYQTEEGLVQEWVISSPDEDKRFAMIEAGIQAACEAIPPAKLIKPPKFINDQLCNTYVLTDYHMGMLVKHAVSGAGDWDIGIAEETLYRCFEYLVLNSPPAAVGLLAQIGDFLHTDGLKAMTPTSGHLLDVADTYEEIAKATVRVLRRAVQLMLLKHQRVHIIMGEGNHDLAGSVWLRVIFSALYEGDPRVTVDTSAVPYYAYQHGETMLAFHHGHLKKLGDLPLLFASTFARMWGETIKRYGHTGHYHHEREIQEFNGMKMTQHPTLAPNDSHSRRHGYDSQQEMVCTTYHKTLGRVGDLFFTPLMLAEAA